VTWVEDETKDYRQSPVFDRGWIVQERMLAPRVLHFVSGGIVWECAKSEARDFHPHVKDRTGMLPGKLSGPEKSRRTLLWLWYWVVWHYSATQLTRPNEDKIVAVQGVNKRIADSLNDTLFFGFLASAMPQSMCWRTGSDPSSAPADNQSYPSWHFARLNTRVCLEDTTDREGGFNRPLVALFHNSKVDPTLPAVPEFLACVARTISLAVRSDDDDGFPGRQHMLSLSRSTQHADGQHTLRSSILTSREAEPLFLTLDQQCLESDLASCRLVLLPVSLEGPLHALQKKQRLASNDEERAENSLWLKGLLLQRKRNGDFLHKGVSNCYDERGGATMRSLLEALRRARLEFVILR